MEPTREVGVEQIEVEGKLAVVEGGGGPPEARGAKTLSQVIRIDEGRIQEHLGEVVRSTVERSGRRANSEVLQSCQRH